MDPDAPWQGSQEAAARKAVELSKTSLRAATADRLLAQKAGIPSLATSSEESFAVRRGR